MLYGELVGHRSPACKRQVIVGLTPHNTSGGVWYQDLAGCWVGSLTCGVTGSWWLAITGVSVIHTSGLTEGGNGGRGSGLGVHLLEREGKYLVSFEKE